MPHPPRIVIPTQMYHVRQRGTRKQTVFGDAEDIGVYLNMLRERLDRYGVVLHQYCCMTNHVHLLVQPFDRTGLSRAIQSAHSNYAKWVNKKNEWIGHLWHARFKSSLVWPAGLLRVMRYIARNPVKGNLVMQPVDWPYASTRDLAGLELDPYITSRALHGLVSDWKRVLARPLSQAVEEELKGLLQSGAPVGDPSSAA